MMRKVLLMAVVAAMSVMLASVAFAGAKKDKLSRFVYILRGDEVTLMHRSGRKLSTPFLG